MRITLIMLALVALAGYATPPPDTAPGALSAAYDAITHGQWWIAAGAALALVHLGLMQTRIGDYFDSDVGKVALAALLAITGGVGHALLAGAPFDATLATTIAETFMAGVACYVVPKKLLVRAAASSADPTDPPFPGGPL